MTQYQNDMKKMAQGDNANSDETEIKPVEIPETHSPVCEKKYQGAGGREFVMFYRTPPSDSAVPTIVFCHGGLGECASEDLRNALIKGAIQTRFLKKGYATIQITRRTFANENGVPITSLLESAVQDTISALNTICDLDFVKKEALAIYAGSAGGTMAMGAAIEIDLAALVLGEPGSVFLSGVFDALPAGSTRQELRNDLNKYYQDEHKKKLALVVDKINAPTLLLQGKKSYISDFNHDHLVPVYQKKGKAITEKVFPNLSHGFYWGRSGANEAIVDEIVEEVDKYLRKYLKIKPRPLKSWKY
jgi:dipeptidyl aminopeptidase/acylaminoacyl peptidase